MDLNTYREIMKLRGEDPGAKKKGEKFGVNAAVIGFRQDLCSNKAIWVDEYWKDFQIFIYCYHPLVSIFTVPRVHPYSSKERIFVLICVTILSCWFGWMSAIADASVGYIISIIGGIFIGIIGGILKALATCSCVQGCHPIIRRCFESIGQLGMCLWGIVSIVLFIIVIILVVSLDNSTQFVISFILSLVTSWITAFLKLLFWFHIKWKKQHLIKLSKQPYFICYQDYKDYINKVPLSREAVRTDKKKENEKTSDDNASAAEGTKEQLEQKEDNNEYAISVPVSLQSPQGQQQQQVQIPIQQVPLQQNMIIQNPQIQGQQVVTVPMQPMQQIVTVQGQQMIAIPVPVQQVVSQVGQQVGQVIGQVGQQFQQFVGKPVQQVVGQPVIMQQQAIVPQQQQVQPSPNQKTTESQYNYGNVDANEFAYG